MEEVNKPNDIDEETPTEENDIVLPDERSAEIELDGKTYRLLYTNGAMLAFAKELGGVERYIHQFDEESLKDLSFADILPDTLTALRILINQGIMYENLTAEVKRPLVTAELLELTTNPGDIVAIRAATLNAIARGMRRNVLSEPPEKKHRAE